MESLFALADSLDAKYAAARAQVNRLTPALLAKAFRGELVPQDLNDEPADVRLARLCGDAARVVAQVLTRGAAAFDQQEGPITPLVPVPAV
ncbi:hypothetical protein GCM10028796_50970 [Ramlibacter monticola]